MGPKKKTVGAVGQHSAKSSAKRVETCTGENGGLDNSGKQRKLRGNQEVQALSADKGESSKTSSSKGKRGNNKKSPQVEVAKATTTEDGTGVTLKITKEQEAEFASKPEAQREIDSSDEEGQLDRMELGDETHGSAPGAGITSDGELLSNSSEDDRHGDEEPERNHTPNRRRRG